MRPKAVIEHDGLLWIAKFQRHDDEIDQCAAEHATMRLAAHCGIRAAETALVDVGGGRRAVLVKRFDRGPEPDFRPTAHFVSALSLLDLEETSTAGSYAQIAGVLRQHGAGHAAIARSCSAACCSTCCAATATTISRTTPCSATPRAGASRRPSTWWRRPPSAEPVQAIAVGALGGLPTVENCLSRCGEFGLSVAAANEIADRMIGVMRGWRHEFRACGVPEATIRRLARSFAPVARGGA